VLGDLFESFVIFGVGIPGWCCVESGRNPCGGFWKVPEVFGIGYSPNWFFGLTLGLVLYFPGPHFCFRILSVLIPLFIMIDFSYVCVWTWGYLPALPYFTTYGSVHYLASCLRLLFAL